jgi:Tfp pilus assembly protein PilF
VIGLDGKPVPNAVIKMARVDMKQNYQVKTNKQGHYLHMGLPVGATFDLSLEIDGKPVDQMKGVKGSIGEPMKVDFDLRKSAAMLAQRKQAIDEATRTGGKISDELTRGMSDEEKQALQKAADDRAEQLKKNKALDDSYSAAVGFLNQKQYDQAIPSFQKAAELDPKQPAVWAGLADAYLGQASTKTGAEYDAEVQKGIDAYNKAIELKPTDAGLHNNYGRALAAARKTAEAQAEMSKAAELDPAGAGKYYYNLGAILTNSGQTDAAAEAFKKATAADPNYADAYYQLGVGLVGKAQIDTATGKVTPAPGTVEAFQKYLELAPQGQFAAGAQDMLKTLGSSVDTSYKNPSAPAPAAKKSTTKKK